MLKYEDFEIKIHSKKNNKYSVSTLNSPIGKKTGSTFINPFSPTELQEIETVVEEILERSLENKIQTDQDANVSSLIKRVEDFGKKLYSALFSDGVLLCFFKKSLDLMRNMGKGLRLTLLLHPSLMMLPWEFMYHPEDKDFLAFLRISLVRVTEKNRRSYADETNKELNNTPFLGKVLVVCASPSDNPPIDIDKELWKIRPTLKELSKADNLHIIRGKDTYSRLQDKLLKMKFNILHFIGHGTYDDKSREGFLVLEDEYGKAEPLSGTNLGRLLREEQYQYIRLVVLNACKGARTSIFYPFTDVATHVVRECDAADVVAMRFKISDSAAIIFSKHFYSVLRHGDLRDPNVIDSAVAAARRAIAQKRKRDKSIEWVTPILFKNS